jgi:hypothetical protein
MNRCGFQALGAGAPLGVFALAAGNPAANIMTIGGAVINMNRSDVFALLDGGEMPDRQ